MQKQTNLSEYPNGKIWEIWFTYSDKYLVLQKQNHLNNLWKTRNCPVYLKIPALPGPRQETKVNYEEEELELFLVPSSILQKKEPEIFFDIFLFLPLFRACDFLCKWFLKAAKNNFNIERFFKSDNDCCWWKVFLCLNLDFNFGSWVISKAKV